MPQIVNGGWVTLIFGSIWIGIVFVGWFKKEFFEFYSLQIYNLKPHTNLYTHPHTRDNYLLKFGKVNMSNFFLIFNPLRFTKLIFFPEKCIDEGIIV